MTEGELEAMSTESEEDELQLDQTDCTLQFIKSVRFD